MARTHGVDPNATTRLDLSDGHWIDVKTRLSVGEQRKIQRLTAKGYQHTKADGSGEAQYRVDLDPTMFGIVRAATYIKGWSMLNFHGQAIALPINVALEERIKIIEREIDPDTMDEIEQVLAEHIRVQEEAREQAKKAQGGSNGETASGATSSSPASSMAG